MSGSGFPVLAAALMRRGVSQRQAAEALGISPAALNLIINKGQWPRTDTRALGQRVADYLVSLGTGRAKALAAILDQQAGGAAMRPASKGKDSAAEKKEINMIRKHTLSPKAKRAFSIVRDPFTDHIGPEDLYLSKDLRFIRETILQTARHGGLLAVIGESGSGKSTLRRELVHALREDGKTIVIEPYVLGMEDNDKAGKTMRALHIAESVLFTVAPSQKCQSSPEARFRQMDKVLKASHAAGNRHCLIVEEAHSLSFTTIKHLKRFYELTEGYARLLSIILIGQPELEAKLSESNAEVREVVQRCERVHLKVLDDVKGYVTHRCKQAGLDAAALFEDAVFDLLPAKLKGPGPKDSPGEGAPLAYPLAVGNMLTLALNAAAVAGESRVTADILMAL